MAHALQYKKEFCDLLIKHMSKGFSFSTFSTVAGVSRNTLYEWVDKYPEFKEAKTKAEDEAKKFMETRLMAKLSGQDLSHLGINTKSIDTTALIFALKTRFYKEYGDRAKHEVSGDIKHNIVNGDVDDEKL